MKTLNLSTLQAFQHFSVACKIQFLETCPNEFIKLLSKCIANLLQGNLSEVKRIHVLRYRDGIHELFLKKNILEATKKSHSVAKRIVAHKNNFPLRHLSLALRWSSLFQYLFLSTTAATTQQLSQNKNYPNPKLSKLPRTRKIR